MSPIPSMSSQSMAAGSLSSLIVEDERGYETDLSTESTDTEINRDTSSWSRTDKKKLQHMTEFHTKYQHVFGVGASIRTIMKRRICRMNPPMPKIICEEEMQNDQLDNDEVIIQYITDAQGNKIKKLKPVFIKSKPDRDHVMHIDNDDIPAVPEENFTRERERTVDSYSESLSSDDEPSDDRTMTPDSDSSEAAVFEETTIGRDADPNGIEATLHQIVTGLKNAAEGYLAQASHVAQVDLYELPQSVAQIPPSPMDALPIRKALLIDGEHKTVSYLIHGEYELANTSWSKLQEKYHISRDKVYTAMKRK